MSDPKLREGETAEPVEASEEEARQVVGGAGAAGDQGLRVNLKPLASRGAGSWDQGFAMIKGDGCVSAPGGPSC